MISSRLFVISITDIHPMTQSRSCFTIALSILFLFSVSSGSSVVPLEFIDYQSPCLRVFFFLFILTWDSRVVFWSTSLRVRVTLRPLFPPFLFILCLLSPQLDIPIISWCPSSAILCVTIYHAFFHIGLTCTGGQ
ncbi:hypothetical protein ASPBRDRAFT_509383 [Aspergillus brasiliensis CBS 101740]|uniref:Uncharacterized protein n=1 Tax=Aspergillus brasiliensis (strain CBS 101740 / IMI 381727 / IBT 21946) TaxID=767769 RepID=A0A1L9UPL9_ASPBC|nr:hypothetical protein ASPBRDRAFT_509383 [Aspergillus brasiliensis CBS 101740]